MIRSFVDRFMASKSLLEKHFRGNPPHSYGELIKALVIVLDNELDPEKIHEINDGDYQGTLLFVVGAKRYQPSDYWFTTVRYGSCSGCDTLKRVIEDFEMGVTDNEDSATLLDSMVKDMMTLALHIMQNFKKMT